MKIRTKLTLSFVVVVTIPMLLLTLISLHTTTKALHEEYELSVAYANKSAMGLYENYLRNAKFIVKNFQNDITLKNLLIEGDKYKLQDYMHKLYFHLYEEFGVDCLDVTDKNGFLVADSEKLTLDNVHFGEDRKCRKTIKEVLSTGKTVSFLEIEPEGTHKTDFWINTVSPIYDDASNLIGTVNVGYSLGLVDAIKKVIGVDTVFYFNNEVLASTIGGFQRADQAKIDDPVVLNKVLKKGEKYLSHMKIKEVGYETFFSPITDDNEKIVGMLSTLMPSTNILASINNLRNIQIGLLFGFIIVAIFLGYYISRAVSRPIIKLKDAANKISEGKFDTILENKSKDEIGDLTSSFNIMTNNLSVSIENEKKLAKFPSEDPSPVLRVSNDKIILYLNIPASHIMSKIGCKVGSILTGNWEKYIDEVLNTGSTVNDIEIAYDENIYSYNFIPIADSHYINIYGTDITERINSEKEKNNLREKLFHSEKMATIGELSAGLSHEINQPLGSLLLTSEILEIAVKKKDLKRIEILSGKVKSQVERISRLVTSLNIFSRNCNQDKFESVDLNESIESIATLLAPQNKLDGIELELKLYGYHPIINASRIDIERVLMNILNNARFAVSSNTGEKIITVKSFNKNNTNFVLISDNGSGIPKDIIKKIFDPFFTTKEIGQGTGLGLSMCYGIVQKYSGMISVESEVDKGTTFTIIFPEINK